VSENGNAVSMFQSVFKPAAIHYSSDVVVVELLTLHH